MYRAECSPVSNGHKASLNAWTCFFPHWTAKWGGLPHWMLVIDYGVEYQRVVEYCLEDTVAGIVNIVDGGWSWAP